MATSLSNETSTTSLVELSQNNQHYGIQQTDCSYGSSSKSQITTTRSDNNGFSSGQGANAMTTSNSSQNYSLSKSRGDSIQNSQFYQQSQSSAMQGSIQQYPSILYPNAFLQTYTSPMTSSYNNYQGSVVGSGNMTTSQSSSTSNSNRRGGKKKAPPTQSQNPELRLFFNLRRRDSQIQTNKGQSHVYKLKNPPQITEWFKRLSVEERVNALSTVCPHLTETLIKMSQHLETKQYQFGKRSSHQTDKYNSIIKLQSPLPYQYANDVVSTKFEDNFYVREISDSEIHHMGHNEKEIMLAEKVWCTSQQKIIQEIMDCVKLTDYFTQLDTLTVTEELVQDADDFFKKMGKATNNQAFTGSCQFELKNQNPVIEQPSWFKPISFHNFTIWIIVALEENLWAHYNYDNNTNMGTSKTNDLSILFREKTEQGAQDIELSQLYQYWSKNANEEDKQILTNQLKTAVLKELEQEFNSGHGGTTKSHKVVNKNMQYSIQIKEKPEVQALQEYVDRTVDELIDQSLKQGKELEFLTNLIYTNIERIKERQVYINRKFLDLIKKKLKDDLMENLLLEEQTSKSSKQFKKKKKKNFTNQQSAQGLQSTSVGEKAAFQSSTENTTNENDTGNEDQVKSKNKKKKGKTAIAQDLNFQPSINSINPQPKKKKNQTKGRTTKESQQVQRQDTHSCDEQQQKIDDDSLEKEDTVESDNKNSSLDTKSSSNLFDQATAHHSNNSGTNSAATFNSILHKDGLSYSKKVKESIPPSINSSKSQELNQGKNPKQFVEQSKIKSQKLNTKIETKNYQILQISSNQERNKNDSQKRKNSSNKFNSNQIFSEDDANSAGKKNNLQETEGESDSMEIIRSYVLELTNQMINEVCRQLENESPNRHIEEPQKVLKPQQNQNTTGVKSLKDDSKQPNNNNRQKKQKNDNNYYGNGGQKHTNNDANRKKSFNAKKYIKEEKHFEEDHYEKNSQYQNLHNQSDLNESQPGEQPVQMSQSRKQSYNDKQNAGVRKGFGTHLKPGEKAIEETRQPIPNEFNQAWAKGTAKTNEYTSQKKKSFSQKEQEEKNEQDSSQSKNNPEINETASQSTNKDETNSTQTQNKKKRNKKKVKLTDSDIMNNFMKNLHQVDESKSQNDLSHQYKKGGNRSDANKYKEKIQPKQQTDIQSEIQQQTIKIDASQNQEDNKSQGKNYKGRYSQKNSLVENQSQSQMKPIEEEPAQPQQSEQQSASQLSNGKKNNQYRSHKSYQQQKRNTLKPPEPPIITDDKESANSTKAECLSDDKSIKSQNEKVDIQDDQLNNKSNAFRQLNFQTPVIDSQDASFADFTETTNSNVNSSIENTNYISKCQSYSSTPCKATAYYPKNHNMKPNANNMEMNEQESANFRTPPQLSKKTTSSNTYSHTGNFRKPNQNGQIYSQNFNSFQPNQDTQYQSTSTLPKNSQRTQPQYRQTSRPQQQQQQPMNSNTQYQQQVQPMNIAQSMQEQRFINNFLTQENNNIFYQDQNVFIPQSVDTQYKSQEGIFQYVEKNPMVMQSPLNVFTPTQYQPAQYASIQGQDLLPNPFTYQQNRMPSYFDQSQDLIYQIFNSIKSNHSMSPISQMMSPPPLVDYQMSQVSDLSLQPQMSEAFSINGQFEHYNQIAFHQLLDQEIEEYNSKIEENIYLLKPERDYILNKIQEIANQVFGGENPQIVLFGSLTTGLALESSDMDLAVTNLKIDDRYIMVQDLNKLSAALQDWKILESFKSIETASIPVIKMKVDLEKLRQIELKEEGPDDFQKRPISTEQRYLSVDITFDDSSSPINFQSLEFGNPSQMKTHLGLQSCSLVQHYIASYKSLKPVAILLKKFLVLHDLSSPYYVAYMNYYGMRGNYDLTPSRLLMGFLEFYGSYFSPSSMGISVCDEGSSFFPLSSLLDSNFVILDPLNLSNNTTKNSYHTKEILMKFQCVLNNLKSLMSKLPLLQQAALSSQQAALSKANSQDQKSSIPYDKQSLQPTQFLNNFSIQQTSINQCEQQTIIEEEEKGCDQVPQQHVQVESEACRLALSAMQDSLINQPLNVQVGLLETFFAKDAQPVTDLRGLSQSQSEPSGTQINMIDEALPQ